MSESDRPRSPFAGMADLSARTPVRVLSPDEMERILAEHQLYLETEYHQGHRANFSSADLTGRDFSGLNLRGIKMDRALLSGADFTGAHLQSVNLVGAIAEGACFDRADLSRARLSGANLASANFEGRNSPTPASSRSIGIMLSGWPPGASSATRSTRLPARMSARKSTRPLHRPLTPSATPCRANTARRAALSPREAAKRARAAPAMKDASFGVASSHLRRCATRRASCSGRWSCAWQRSASAGRM